MQSSSAIKAERALLPAIADEESAVHDSMSALLRAVARAPEARPRAGLPEGTTAGDYRLLEIIGRGAFGTVYRAVHPVIGKAAAVKVLDGRGEEEFRLEERFVAEARAVNRINHRNIVDIFGIGELPNGQKFYVMELLSGQTLSALLAQKGALSPDVALAVLEPLADALDAAHAAGVLHRDLKPANVFLQQGPPGTTTIKLLDFGVAKILESNDGLTTRSGTALGTPAYMAPEQSMGEAVGPATDIYALGLIAYELLTGSRPFKADSARALITMHLFEAPPLPSSKNPKLTRVVDAVLLRMLAKEPEHRPNSAREAIVALRLGFAENASGLDCVASNASTLEIAVVPESRGAQANIAAAEPTHRTASAARRRASRARIGLAAALAGFGLTIAGYGRVTAHTAVRSAELPTRVVTVSAPSLRGSADKLPALTPAVQSAPVAVATKPPVPPTRVSLGVPGLPLGTVAYRGAQRLQLVHERFELPFSDQALDVRFTAPGYVSSTVPVVPDHDQEIEVHLKRSAASSTQAAMRGNPAGELEY